MENQTIVQLTDKELKSIYEAVKFAHSFAKAITKFKKSRCIDSGITAAKSALKACDKIKSLISLKEQIKVLQPQYFRLFEMDDKVRESFSSQLSELLKKQADQEQIMAAKIEFLKKANKLNSITETLDIVQEQGDAFTKRFMDKIIVDGLDDAGNARVKEYIQKKLNGRI